MIQDFLKARRDRRNGLFQSRCPKKVYVISALGLYLVLFWWFFFPFPFFLTWATGLCYIPQPAPVSQKHSPGCTFIHPVCQPLISYSWSTYYVSSTVWDEGTEASKGQSRPSRASHSAFTQAITVQCGKWGPPGQHRALKGGPQEKSSEKGSSELSLEGQNWTYSGRSERMTQADERHTSKRKSGGSPTYKEYNMIG